MMLTATCSVCQTRVNLLAEKLVSVQWVDAKSGALATLHFHSDCYVKWHRETAASIQRRSQAAPELPPSAKSATGAEAPDAAEKPRPEAHLSTEEIKRLEQLRARRTRPQAEATASEKDEQPRAGSEPSPEASGSSVAGDDAGKVGDGHENGPDTDDHDDRHDVPPPQV